MRYSGPRSYLDRVERSLLNPYPNLLLSLFPNKDSQLLRRCLVNLWWAALLLMAVCFAYVGFEETRLRLHCPKPMDLTVSELGNETTDGPIWVHFEAAAVPADAAIVTSQSGVKRGVWVPVTAPNEKTTVVAVLQAKDLKEARNMKASEETLQIEGLAYYPSTGTSKILRTYLRQVGLRIAPGLRVVEMGRRPGSLFGSLALLLVGAAVALWAAVGVVRHAGRPRHGSKKAQSLVGLHSFAELESTPLPEDVRVEVSHMLDDAWNRVRAR